MHKIITLTLLVLAGSFQAQAASDGARLYARNCAACHGENGGGGLGVPLSLPSFQATVSNDYLHQTIRLGRPGRVMPTSALPDTDIDAIVSHIRSWNKAPAPQFSTTPVKGNAEHGRALYAAQCAACHGAGGEGGKGTGVTFSRPRDLPIMAPALNNPGFLAAASDSMIKKTLMNGREGTPMVSFLKQGLKEKDIDDIVSFIRSLEKISRPRHAEVLETEQAVLTVDSPYDLKTTIENVKRAASSNNFLFIREQPLSHGLAPTGQEDPRQQIIYFCNFSMLNAALATDPRVGLFLPCRITVVEQNGKVKMMTVNPKRLSKIFNNAELNTLCDEMTKHYLTIMEEAAI
ncbi:cytochrome C [Sulfuricella sp. T08]|uniref:c-type cytochrome n=1 Tax=Sulfuricella sp. T08 TaxID=1632857 RepID=UPI0006179793|nr:c-type cytochrome [Sulfuricella sp. T08]GAO37116.1 cytochrome C [Sulfuricella sp. T08]